LTDRPICESRGEPADEIGIGMKGTEVKVDERQKERKGEAGK
jgi:hypothetical protein